MVPSSIGLMAVPRFAPSTSANAAAGGTVPCAANDMITSTMATLECVAQVKTCRQNHIQHRLRRHGAQQQAQAGRILVRGSAELMN